MILGLATSTALAQPNILVIVADDLGVDKLARYQSDVPGYVPSPGDMPVTPMIDALVDDGVRFRNAWSNPVCSPTRAGLMTGRHAFRNGVGGIISETLTTPSVALTETTIAEALDATYTTALFGKWHLGLEGGDDDGDDDPLDWSTLGIRDIRPPPSRQGFEVFDGILSGAPSNYWQWKRITAFDYGLVGGDEETEIQTESAYNTASTAQAAADFMVTAAEPWLAVVSFSAPHVDGIGWNTDHALEGCSTITSAATDAEAYRAMIECLDFYVDDMLADLDAAGRLDDTVIFFVGDNGTDAVVADPDFPRAADGKGTPYESGIRVPLVVTEGKHLSARPYDRSYAGPPYVPGDLVNVGRSSFQAVNTVDLYDTILGLAGLPQTGQDSIGFGPQLVDPLLPGRFVNYTERFYDQDGDGIFFGIAIARTPRYKLIVWQDDDGTGVACQRGALYDLVADRAEAVNLYDDPLRALDRSRLRAYMDGLITTYETNPANPPHWMWRLIDAPRTTGTCP